MELKNIKYGSKSNKTRERDSSCSKSGMQAECGTLIAGVCPIAADWKESLILKQWYNKPVTKEMSDMGDKNPKNKAKKQKQSQKSVAKHQQHVQVATEKTE